LQFSQVRNFEPSHSLDNGCLQSGHRTTPIFLRSFAVRSIIIELQILLIRIRSKKIDIVNLSSKPPQTPEFIDTNHCQKWTLLIRALYNKILREAFESTLDILGYSGRTCLIRELEDSGAYTTSDDSYLSLWKMGNGLQNMFGREIAQMIIENVMIRMDKLCSTQRVGRSGPNQR